MEKDDITPEEDFELEEELEEGEEKDWEAEAKKFKAIAERRKAQLEKIQSKPEEKKTEKQITKKAEPDVATMLREQDERVDLRMQGYTNDEINFASRNREGEQTLTEAVKNPFVEAGISSMRAKRRSEEATPSPSGSTMKFEGKTFAEVISGDDAKAKQNAFDNIVSKRLTNQSE